MKVIFIAGPFRAPTTWQVELNIRKAEALALEVWRAGYAAICPHTNTRFFDKELPDEVWLNGIHEILRRCDGMILVKGPISEGMKAEINVAKETLIPIFKDISALKFAMERA